MKHADVLIRRDEVVSIHLNRLEEILQAPEPSQADAIHASMALRFLFESAALGRVGSDRGVEIKVPAPSLDGVPIDQALFFVCGGYRLGRTSVMPYYLYRQPGPNSPHYLQFESQVAASPREHLFREVKLSRFETLPCLSLLGNTFTRGELIRYIANKCGGAHHHNDQSKFNALEAGLTSIGQAVNLSGNGLSAVFLETLGSAWFLLQAPNVSGLRKLLANA